MLACSLLVTVAIERLSVISFLQWRSEDLSRPFVFYLKLGELTAMELWKSGDATLTCSAMVFSRERSGNGDGGRVTAYGDGGDSVESGVSLYPKTSHQNNTI